MLKSYIMVAVAQRLRTTALSIDGLVLLLEHSECFLFWPESWSALTWSSQCGGAGSPSAVRTQWQNPTLRLLVPMGGQPEGLGSGSRRQPHLRIEEVVEDGHGVGGRTGVQGLHTIVPHLHVGRFARKKMAYRDGKLSSD